MDHNDYLTQNPEAYDTWKATLQSSAVTIPIDTEHIIARHVVWAGREFAAGDESGELFLLPGWVGNPPQMDAARRDIEALVRDCLANFQTVIAKSDSLLCARPCGGQIGLSDFGNSLDTVHFAIDTIRMSTWWDWQNAVVTTAYPT
ncbi:hypothetical protein [Streptomyces wuyuanensis]|uniref:hypothetical protein n=1 Tax=Streptomyces wuyuanensis TaxID=1196353 RepID=UPI0034368D65